MSDSPADNIETEIPEQSNTAAEGVIADSPAANEGSATAESPAAKQAEVKETLVDRIKKAADISSEKAPDTKKDGAASDPNAKPEGEAAEEDEPFTKDDLNNLHSKTRKRVGKMLATIENLSKEREQILPAARQYGAVIGFLKDNDLTMDDANKAFDTLHAIRHDPARALEMLTPIYQQLLQATGSVLPEDLQQQVDAGYITEAHARELSQLRAGKTQQTVQQQDQAQRNQRNQNEAQKKTVHNIEQSITAWETKWRSTDPDYKAKQPKVQKEIELALSRAQRAGKLPKSPEEAIALAEKARKDVEAEFSQYRPVKKAVQHVSGGSAVASSSQPKTLQEAILQAANG